MKTLITFFTLFVSLQSAVATEIYSRERMLIQENERAIIGSADDAFQKALEFKKHWNDIGFSLRLLNQNLAIYKKHLVNTGNAKQDLFSNLVNESVFVSRAISDFQSAQEKISESILKSKKVAQSTDWLKTIHEKYGNSVALQLQSLRSSLEQRKARSEKNMALWHQRQFQSWVQSEAAKAKKLAGGIEVDALVARLPGIFMNLNQRVRMAILRKQKAEAVDTLTAIVWFRASLPLFFADKPLSESARFLLQGTIQTSEEIENGLRDLVNEMRTSQLKSRGPQRMMASIMEMLTDEPSESDDNGFGPDYDRWKANKKESDFGTQPKDSREYVENGRPTVEFSERGDTFDFASKSVAEAKSVNEYSVKGGVDGMSKNANIGGQGFVRVEGGRAAENVAVETHDQVREKIRDYLNREQGGHWDTPDRIQSLLSRAEPRVDESIKREFDQLRAEAEHLRKTVELFEKVVREAKQEIGISKNRVESEMKTCLELASDGPMLPSIEQVFPAYDPNQIDIAWNGLRAAIQASPNASLKDYSGFVQLSSTASNLDSYYPALIVNDALDELQGVPVDQRALQSIPGNDYSAKVKEAKLRGIEKTARQAARSGQMSISESVQITSALSRLIQEYNITSAQIATAHGGYGLTYLSRLRAVFDLAGRVIIGFTPLGAAIDLHDLVTGRDLFTGQKLSDTQRMVSALGLVLGQGKNAQKLITFLEASIETKALATATKVLLSKETKAFLGNKYVRALPDLADAELEAFRGPYLKAVVEPGDIYFQAQRANQLRPGNWFTPIRPVNPAHAEELLFIAKYENYAEQIKMYRIKERVSGYVGMVAKGEGHQVYIPENVILDEVLEEIKF